MLLLLTLLSPEEAAVSVYVPEVFRIKSEKVATPFTAFTVSVPPTPAGVELIVTEAVDPVNGFPFSSSTCTTTGLNVVPAASVAGGSVENASCGIYAR
jgi:hypothetical protein